MFGSKTTRLIGSIDRYVRQKKNVVAFKPKIDNRYSRDKICTHNGASFQAYTVSDGIQMKELLKDLSYDVIAIDEAFMIDGCSDVAINEFRKGKTILISSIQLSSNCEPFEEVSKMLPWATKIEVCSAICPVTGNDAYYTAAKFSNKDKTPKVGADDLYEPRSHKCHPCFIDYE